MPEFQIATAAQEDNPAIWHALHAIAEEENDLQRFSCNERQLESCLFEKKYATCLVARCNGDAGGDRPIAGLLIYSMSFSTYLGKPVINVLDDFVYPKYRNRGAGRALFAELARVAIQHRVGRIDSRVLKWDKFSVGFYRNVLGANILTDCEFIRLEGNDALRKVAELAD